MSLKLLPPLILLTLTLSGSLPDVLSTSTPSLIRTWSYGYGTLSYGNDLAVDSSRNITIVGGVSGPALLLRYNSTGSLLLQRSWSGPNYQEATAVAVDASDNAYMTGRTSSFGASPGGGIFRVFLLKFGSAGNLLWQETYSGNGYEGRGATLDLAGGVVVSGSGVLLKFNSSGFLAWQDTWTGSVSDFFGVVEDHSGDIYAVSETTILKLNSTGGLLWARGWSGMTGAGISLDASGNIYLVGPGPTAASPSSIYLLKLTPEGILLWQRRWQTSSWTMTNAGVVANGTGIIYTTADMTTCVPNPRGCNYYDEPLILEFNSTGGLIGQLAIHGGWGELGRPSTDSAGSLYLVGSGGIAGESFCSPSGGLKMSEVSLAAAAGQVLRTSYSVTPSSGVVSTPMGNETSQSGVVLMKFDSAIMGGSVTCSSPLSVFPLTLPMITLMGLVIIMQARRRLHRSLEVES